MTTVRIDKDRCIGSGNCVWAAPELFDQDDEEGKAYLLGEPAPGLDLRDIAERCPVAAIIVEEAAA